MENRRSEAMKHSFAITAVAAIIMAFGQGSAQAAMPSTQLDASVAVESFMQKTGSSYDDDGRYEYHRLSRRRFTKRQYDRLPIRTTRPGNTGHYTFQDFPHWAARAFEKPWNR
jgi:hypothetical protein